MAVQEVQRMERYLSRPPGDAAMVRATSEDVMERAPRPVTGPRWTLRRVDRFQHEAEQLPDRLQPGGIRVRGA